MPEFLEHASRTPLSILIWAVSLLLQATLFISLFSRRIAGYTPFFANLVAFYFVRSLLFLLLLGHISASSYSRLYSFFLWIELLVQLCVAVDLTRWLVRTHGGWIRSNIITPIVMVAVSAISAYLIAELTPHGEVPIDRGTVFFSFYMVFFWLWTFTFHEHVSNGLVLTQGFAIYGLINIVSNIGRVRAAFYDHPARYGAWTSVLAGAYLVVVLFWLSSLKPMNGKKHSPVQQTTI
ncbi:MAG TPA: hypothetical protein VIX90_16055 [Edaphobacter sp.]